MTVVGIDPGGKSVGIVVRDGDRLVNHAVVTNPAPAIGLPTSDFLWDVEETIATLTQLVWVHTWAMESVTPPRGFKNGRHDAIQPGSLIGVSAVAGYLLRAFPGIVLVPPAGNGSHPLRTYPTQLVGVREVKGGGILRHARSAWDVAGAVKTKETA